MFIRIEYESEKTRKILTKKQLKGNMNIEGKKIQLYHLIENNKRIINKLFVDYLNLLL